MKLPMGAEDIHDGQETTIEFEDYVLTLIVGQTHFSNEAREKIIADLGPHMPDLDVAGYFRSQPAIFTEYDFLLVATESATGAVIGLFGTRWRSTPSRRLLYIWTAFISSTFRSSRLYGRMQASMLSGVAKSNQGLLPELIVMKTHNPRAFYLMNKHLHGKPGIAIFPQIPGPQSPAMSAVAKDIAASLWPNAPFSADTGVLRGVQAAISPNFFPPISESRNDLINEYFRSNLTRDDQILCIAQLPAAATEAFLASPEA